jgi:dinuclear metal center YbgI/SA1388 family protein
MAERNEIIGFCDQLLEIDRFEDYGPNGLQIPGTSEVERIATGVSAQLELFQRAIDAGAQMLLTHHGTFWDAQPSALTERLAARLRTALGANLSVAAYHLPLDAHAEIGNNALLCSGLGFEAAEKFADFKGMPIGIVGRSGEGVAPADLRAKVAELCGQEPLVFDAGPGVVHSIGIVSGAGTDSLQEAIGLGLDAFLTGEPSEWAMADSREGGIHFLAAGHYATETFGIRRLGELVAERFGLEHEFIDIPNPI